MDVPVPPSVEEIVEKTVAVLVPQIIDNIVEVIKRAPLERMSERVVEQIAAVLVPQIMTDIVNGLQHVPLRTDFVALHWKSVHCEDASSSW